MSTNTPEAASLAPAPTRAARARSRLLRELLRAAPRSVLVTRGPLARDRPRVALTFDDGPDEMTPRYLDVLDRLGVRATFFVIGENVSRRPSLVTEYVARGHDVAGHGYTHTPFPMLAPAVLVDELARTADLLPPCVSRRPFVRPPQGRVSPASLLRVAAAGYTTVLWSLDSDDFRTRDGAELRRRCAPGAVRSGEIVLFHELQAWTLEAIPAIVDGLRAAGFELATVGELLRF